MSMFLWRYKFSSMVCWGKRITEFIYWMCSLVCKKLPPSRVSILLFSPARIQFLLLCALISISQCLCSISGHSSRGRKFTTAYFICSSVVMEDLEPLLIHVSSCFCFFCVDVFGKSSLTPPRPPSSKVSSQCHYYNPPSLIIPYVYGYNTPTSGA